MSELEAAVGLRCGSLHLAAELASAPGEIVAVTGPNGAGKTTLLRALAGLIALESGRVALGPEVLEEPARRLRVPPERRGCAFVFQEPRLFGHMSVLDNVACAARSGASRPAARREAMRVLESMGLGHLAPARPGSLSGGEAHRVALARAAARQGRYLLLDEPLSSVDAAAQPEVRRQIADLVRSSGRPCVLVTHSGAEAAMVSARIVVLEDGRVTQTGTPGEIARTPRSEYAAGLVGINLYRGRTADDAVVVESGALIVPSHPVPGEVFVAVHPKAVALWQQRPRGTPRNLWAMTVAGAEAGPDGVRVSLAGPLDLVAEITPAAAGELGLRPGSKVWASVKASEVEAYPA